MPKDSVTPKPTFAQWLEGARPHTWANAFAPVIVGTGAATYAGGANLWRALAAAVVSWALICGVNYANDYSDGIRGTDDSRSGPLRLVGSGIAKPNHVKYAAFGFFALAAVIGLALAAVSSWWLVALGAVCIAAAWFYTGGSHPYGYHGLGEIAIFIFFGLIAVLGTEFTQAGLITWVGVLCAVAIGALSASVNLVNNLRDIPTDSAAGKITLAVRLGDIWTRRLYLILAATPLWVSLCLSTVTPYALIGLLIAPIQWRASEPVRHGALGRDLIPVLGTTGRAMALWSIITAAALGITALAG
ncbi:1,4-dihydroxy-2-naphthoate prenyltransferase [Corynebacterium mustelae]|uniref:1,4-dihydroxy-2-naphthoate octaprenyltransferase n=1 Tax=Corynebacterium mustelae TaxID=571915 RepID=A0A0G3GYU6_9CORY|nr:1,4-dihydroxy-2-naphthoate polyprenyltransferase [Corynebacterium mustelae]AKK04703.1 1,4-dihydroxy-2-naphthoate prenyltransferase [Corynebacterium mustelae]